MAVWIMIIAFAFASSIDNLGVSISYGIQQIQITVSQNICIAFICFLFSMIGIYASIWAFQIVPSTYPVILGTVFLIVIGIRIMLFAKQNKQSKDEEAPLKNLLKDPESMTISSSKKIGWLESVFLGIALSTNALTNGVGAGLLGLSPFVISFTASIGSFISMSIGIYIGRKAAFLRIGSYSLGQFGTLISGAILILIAAMALFQLTN